MSIRARFEAILAQYDAAHEARGAAEQALSATIERMVEREQAERQYQAHALRRQRLIQADDHAKIAGKK